MAYTNSVSFNNINFTPPPDDKPLYNTKSSPYKRRLRLPPPPKKLILKHADIADTVISDTVISDTVIGDNGGGSVISEAVIGDNGGEAVISGLSVGGEAVIVDNGGGSVIVDNGGEAVISGLSVGGEAVNGEGASRVSAVSLASLASLASPVSVSAVSGGYSESGNLGGLQGDLQNLQVGGSAIGVSRAETSSRGVSALSGVSDNSSNCGDNAFSSGSASFGPGGSTGVYNTPGGLSGAFNDPGGLADGFSESADSNTVGSSEVSNNGNSNVSGSSSDAYVTPEGLSAGSSDISGVSGPEYAANPLSLSGLGSTDNSNYGVFSGSGLGSSRAANLESSPGFFDNNAKFITPEIPGSTISGSSVPGSAISDFSLDYVISNSSLQEPINNGIPDSDSLAPGSSNSYSLPSSSIPDISISDSSIPDSGLNIITEQSDGFFKNQPNFPKKPTFIIRDSVSGNIVNTDHKHVSRGTADSPIEINSASTFSNFDNTTFDRGSDGKKSSDENSSSNGNSLDSLDPLSNAPREAPSISPGPDLLPPSLTPPAQSNQLDYTGFNTASTTVGGTFASYNGFKNQEKPRRKSFAGISDEELLALDPQYQTTKSKTSSIDQFKFDNEKTYYRNAPKKTASNLQETNNYISSNENNYKLLNLTVKHNQYVKYKYNRTLLSIISGRKHTWNSIDWLLQNKIDKEKKEFLDPRKINSSEPENFESMQSVLQDGDYLIVSSLIPMKFLQTFNQKKIEDFLYKKCQALLSFFLEKLNHLKIKLTVEFVLDNDEDPDMTGYKYMIHHLFTQYQPNMFIIGTKSTNLNFKYPVKLLKKQNEYLVKLSSYIVKYSPVPVILIGQSSPYHNCSEFERKRGSSSLKFDTDPRKSRRKSNVSISSDSSLESSEETETASIISNVDEKVDKLLRSRDYDKFSQILTLVSDNSFNASRNYLTAINSKDDSLKVDPKIHAIYRSQFQSSGFNPTKTNSRDSDSKAYRIKSLLGVEEPVKKESKAFKINSTSETPSQMKRRQLSISSAEVSRPILSNTSDGAKSKSEDKLVKKKTSFWAKIGLKKK